MEEGCKVVGRDGASVTVDAGWYGGKHVGIDTVDVLTAAEGRAADEEGWIAGPVGVDTPDGALLFEERGVTDDEEGRSAAGRVGVDTTDEALLFEERGVADDRWTIGRIGLDNPDGGLTVEERREAMGLVGVDSWGWRPDDGDGWHIGLWVEISEKTRVEVNIVDAPP